MKKYTLLLIVAGVHNFMANIESEEIYCIGDWIYYNDHQYEVKNRSFNLDNQDRSIGLHLEKRF